MGLDLRGGCTLVRLDLPLTSRSISRSNGTDCFGSNVRPAHPRPIDRQRLGNTTQSSARPQQPTARWPLQVSTGASVCKSHQRNAAGTVRPPLCLGGASQLEGRGRPEPVRAWTRWKSGSPVTSVTQGGLVFPVCRGVCPWPTGLGSGDADGRSAHRVPDNERNRQ